MRGWDVFRTDLHIIPIDTVYFTVDCDVDYVRRSLIDHDGYPSDIHVQEAK